MAETSPHLIQLIISLQSTAMFQMGKVVHPVSGKIERDLDGAQHAIDLLGMLQEKTAGNLSDDEEKLLTHVLYELRLNYVDEKSRPDPPATDSPDETPPDQGESVSDEQTKDGQ